MYRDPCRGPVVSFADRGCRPAGAGLDPRLRYRHPSGMRDAESGLEAKGPGRVASGEWRVAGAGGRVPGGERISGGEGVFYGLEAELAAGGVDVVAFLDADGGGDVLAL
jgi:hypothetical protein